MKRFINLIAIIFILGGCIWILQGINALPGSFMSGKPEWTRNGSIVAIIGVALIAWNNFMRGNIR